MHMHSPLGRVSVDSESTVIFPPFLSLFEKQESNFSIKFFITIH